MKHKHAELIKAWADGASIQFFAELTQQWVGVNPPAWAGDVQYRIKPESKLDSIKYMTVEAQDNKYIAGLITHQRYHDNNIKLTFDGETSKLKAAEVIGN